VLQFWFGGICFFPRSIPLTCGVQFPSDPGAQRLYAPRVSSEGCSNLIALLVLPPRFQHLFSVACLLCFLFTPLVTPVQTFVRCASVANSLACPVFFSFYRRRFPFFDAMPPVLPPPLISNCTRNLQLRSFLSYSCFRFPPLPLLHLDFDSPDRSACVL